MPCAGAKAPHNIRVAHVPAIRWPTLTPGSLDHALEPAPYLDPGSIGLFTPALRTAAGYPRRPQRAKRVLVERISAFRRTTAISRLDSRLTLARENGSLSSRD